MMLPPKPPALSLSVFCAGMFTHMPLLRQICSCWILGPPEEAGVSGIVFGDPDELLRVPNGAMVNV